MNKQPSRSKRKFPSGKIFLSAMLMPLLGFAQTGSTDKSAFSLSEAQEYAYTHNTGMLNAQLDADVARAKKNEVTGIGLPQVSASFDLKDYVKIPTSLIPAQIFNPAAPPGTFIPVQFGTKYNATAGVQASQIIFSSDYMVGLQASKTYMELSEKNIQRTRVETSAAVSKAYYNVLINRERMKLLVKNIDRLEKLFKDTKALNQNGFVEQIDVDRVELALNNLTVEKEKISRMMVVGESLLKFQMGYDVSKPIQLTDSMKTDPAITVPDSTAKTNFDNRPEYSLLQTQLRLGELDLKRNRLGYLPSLVAYGNLSAQAMRQDFDIFDTDKKWFPIGIIGATVNMPIFDGLQKHQRIQQAKLSTLKTRYSIQNLENAINMEVGMTSAQLQNAIASLTTQKKNMALAENVYRVTKAKYEQGVGSNLEVITAETALKEAQTNYFSALYDYYVAKVDYDKATGSIK